MDNAKDGDNKQQNELGNKNGEEKTRNTYCENNETETEKEKERGYFRYG